MDVRRHLARLIAAGVLAAVLSIAVLHGTAAQKTPLLTDTVNDFAGIIDAQSKAELDRRIRALRQATGDAIVVATVPNYEGFLDIRELAVRMFENQGRGIGDAGRDNGLLIVVSVGERRAAIEVGYELEGIITDGFAGETIRDEMAPHFRQGQYGRGLIAAVDRLVARIAEKRGVSLEGAPRDERRRAAGPRLPPGLVWFFVVLVLLMLRGLSSSARRRRSRRGPWSGWSGGVGPFGGGPFGGGFGGFGRGGFGGGFGGGGGGFGGFGGGRSGGGGAAGGW